MAVTKRYKIYRRGELIGEYTAVEAAAILKLYTRDCPGICQRR